ncbi:MAG: hypothetical protein DMD33_19135 [Gemmatimonadetes bacterium]|nr:MAG: hypothetical protein DMD33_19135 [Gemmatimonadota bacterium]
MNLLRRYPIAFALLALVLVSALSPFPPLVDAVTGAPPLDADLVRPTLYTLLAPVSNLLDALTFLSLERAKAFLITWVAALALWGLTRRGSLGRRLVAAALGPLIVVPLGVAAVLLPRPVVRLVAADSTITVIDYHAHTAASHDGRRGWTALDLAEWHAAQGFGASYVTDHNIVFNGAIDDPIRLLPGVEWSVYRQHVVALGAVAPVDRASFDRDSRSMLGLYAALHRQGAIGLASLPEYWRNGWDDLDAFVAAGVDGFEIVNCAPKAIGFPRVARARVLHLAEAHDLLVVGASDNHGWGKATCVWNLSSPSAHGYRSNRVIARPIALAQGDWEPWTAGYTQPWLMLAGLSWSERSSWLTWILVILIYRAVPRRGGDPAGIGILARSLSLKILKLRRPPAQ